MSNEEKQPLTQHQLWKHLRNGGVLKIGVCEMRQSGDGLVGYTVYDGEQLYAYTQWIDALVALATLAGVVESNKQHIEQERRREL